jgi:hypothetical protein
MTVSLFIPGEIWSSNRERKMHHHARADLVEPLRTTARLLTLNMLRTHQFEPIVGPVHVEFVPYQGRGVLADTANHFPACKAVLDGIVDAKLIPADTPDIVLSHRYWPPRKQTTTGVMVTLIPAAMLPDVSE